MRELAAFSIAVSLGGLVVVVAMLLGPVGVAAATPFFVLLVALPAALMSAEE